MIEMTEPNTMTDEMLVDLARRGDDEAFSRLFARHQAFAIGVARRYAVYGDADDVVSDAFAAMLQHIRRGNGPHDHVRGYLAVSVRNGAISRAKHHVRTRVTDDMRVVDRGVPFGHGISDLGERQQMSTALASLSARQRNVLWAIEVEGFRPREVADELGMTPNTVSAMAYRARRAFREAYLRAG